jgi:hypothetical protein
MRKLSSPAGSGDVPAAPAPQEAPANAVSSGIAAGSSGGALIGWMTEVEATLTLASRRKDQADSDTLREQARGAPEAFAARVARIDQDAVIQPAPEELVAHIEQLAQQPASAGYIAEGWEVMSVDPSRVCSLQPTVRSEQATARVAPRR